MLMARKGLPDSLVVKVVDAESATIPSCGNKVSIRANHVNICRFETRDDGDYQNVAQALKKLSESAGHNEARSVSRAACQLPNSSLLGRFPMRAQRQIQ